MTSSSSWPQILGRVLQFSAGTLFWVIALLIFLAFPWKNGLSIWENLEPALIPNNIDHKMERFAEAEKSGPVDVLFLGSSHSFFSFDPRIFRAAGYSSFNLGTAAQAPTTTLGVYRAYRTRLRPRLVIYESYPYIFRIDGLEDFYSQISTLPLQPKLFKTAWDLRQFKAFQALAVVAFKKNIMGVQSKPRRPHSFYRYISGGFLETFQRSQKPLLNLPAPRQLEMKPEEIQSFTTLLREIRADGIPVVVAIQPIPKNYQATFLNYDAAIQQLQAIARREADGFLNPDNKLNLDPHRHFMDHDHLNMEGVKIFNANILHSLRKLNLQPQNLPARKSLIKENKRHNNRPSPPRL